MTDRLDYLSALMNNWAVAKTVEKAAGIPTNERIETIRTIMAELQRLQSHALWWGVMGMDLGAYTAFLYGFREREIIGEIFEETIGARLTMNYIQPGGLMYDIKADFAEKVKKLLPYLKGCIAQYETLLSGNVIFQERLRNIGIIDGQHALALGCTGPVLRASGVPYDLRAVEPYGVYDKVKFNVVVGAVGDCWDRYYVRLEEMRESVRIIEQLIDNIPEGPHTTIRYNEEIILPEGLHYGQIETARGVLGVFVFRRRQRQAVPLALPIAELQQPLDRHGDRRGLAHRRFHFHSVQPRSRDTGHRSMSTLVSLAMTAASGAIETRSIAQRAAQSAPENLWITTGYLLGSLLGVVALLTFLGLALIYLERKIAAHFQCRLGPNRVGPFGLLQTVADTIKLVFKEDIRAVPMADRTLHLFAPFLALACARRFAGVIPYGPLVSKSPISTSAFCLSPPWAVSA